MIDLWNQVFTGRGAVFLRSSAPLERFVFAKPFFDPAGFFLAFDDERLVGFLHAGMACRTDHRDLGAICLLGVHPDYRRQKVGRELLQRGETFLLERGAKTIFGGARAPANPFGLGVYGGCDSPGWLVSDPLAEPFLLAHGYHVQERINVFQKNFEPGSQYKCIDRRFAQLRNNYTVHVGPPTKLGYWQECTLGGLDPLEFWLEDDRRKQIVARTLVWEMDAYRARWGRAAVGVVDFEVHADYRRKGVGKFLLFGVLRKMQEQFVDLAEIHVSENNPLAIPFLHNMGFEIVDRGQVFVKSVP